MVQVQPVVSGQHARHHLLVIDHVVGYLGIGEHQRHRIVPRQLVLGRIDGYLGGLLQPHGIHIHCRVGYIAQYGAALPVGNHLAGHAAQLTFALYGISIFHHESAATVVKQPRHLHLALQRPIGHAIGLEVVLLRLVHGQEQIIRIRVRVQKKEKQNEE